MNSTSSQQGESIPGIAHAISIEISCPLGDVSV